MDIVWHTQEEEKQTGEQNQKKKNKLKKTVENLWHSNAVEYNN